MTWMDDEPVRGSYPDLSFLGLSGMERMSTRDRPAVPPPPIHHLFGLTPESASDGESSFTMPASPWLQTIVGGYLAGTAALVADAPLGGSILSKVPAGVFGVTSELSMNFLRPAGIESGTLRAHSRVIAVGRSLGLSEANVTDAAGNVLAHSTSRYFLTKVEPTPPRPEPADIAFPTYPTPDPWQRDLPDATRPPADVWQRMSGLEVMAAHIAEELPAPPFSVLFGCRLTKVEEGRCENAAAATGWLTSPARTVYGGVIAYLADSAMMGAVTTTLPAGHSAASLDLKVQFLRPGLADGRDLVVRADVVHRGRSLAITRAEVLNADGKQIALATGSAMVIPRPWQAVAVADEPPGED